MSQTLTLADELYDQFLVCRLCSSNYKQPKSLTCMHTFCAACLEMHHEMEEQDRPYRFLSYTRALSCPLCRIKTELPTGGIQRLPDNFLVANLGDVINRRKPSTAAAAASHPKCEICVRPNGGMSKRRGCSLGRWEEENDPRRGGGGVVGGKAAVIKCLDCVKMLCQSCADLHRRTKVTQMHSLFDVDVQKDVECKVHENEMLRFYCEPCETCICVLCAFIEHKDHDVTSLVEGLERHRGTFEALLETCGTRIVRMREQLDLTERTEKAMARAEAHIRDTAIDAIAAVRKRERELLIDLRQLVGENNLKRIAEKDTARENLKNVEVTFKVTDAMLKGTSIELLMVKKEIQEKLNNFIEQSEENSNENLQKYLEFSLKNHYVDIPAMVDSRKIEIGYNANSNIIDSDFKKHGATVEVQTEAPVIKDASTGTEGDLMEDQPPQKLLQNPETSKGTDSRIKMVVNFLSGSEKELELIQPVEFIVPIEYVTPVTKEEMIETLENHGKFDRVKTHESEDSNKESSGPIASSYSPVSTQTLSNGQNLSANVQNEILSQDSGPKQSSASFSSFENEKVLPSPPSVGSVTKTLDDGDSMPEQIQTSSVIKPQLSSTLISCATGPDHPSVTDFGTSMSSVLYFDKQTSTPHIIMTNKCLSTDNQEMVDKSTCTIIDVAAAYRNMTSSRRLVTVSRGTCTPRAMFPMEIFPSAHRASSYGPEIV